jgi:DNA repair photolyase
MTFSAVVAKRLELLHKLVPNAATVGVLVNPNYPEADSQRREVQESASIAADRLQAVVAAVIDEILRSEDGSAQAAGKFLKPRRQFNPVRLRSETIDAAAHRGFVEPFTMHLLRLDLLASRIHELVILPHNANLRR